ncbi:hypothetical protein ACS0TY_023956 [Phlomoides rotata]
MLGKTSKPVIEILTGSLVSASVSSPRSNVQSPRGLMDFDFGGVGLGIVAALDRCETPPALFGRRNLTRSSPIPVKNSWREEMEMDEEYTIVTCHGPNKSCTTRVYSGRTPFRIQSSNRGGGGVFHISPMGHAEAGGIPEPDFLSSCNLCLKNLHGKDIYMYRGEKAFCSAECRYRQMVADERKEKDKCGSEAARTVAEVVGSPYGNGQMFTTGILAI